MYPRIESLSASLHFPYIPYHYERYYVDLSGSFADYETKFHSKAHYTLRKKLRRFKTASGGTLRWQEYRLPEEITDFHSLARTISSWIGKDHGDIEAWQEIRNG